MKNQEFGNITQAFSVRWKTDGFLLVLNNSPMQFAISGNRSPTNNCMKYQIQDFPLLAQVFSLEYLHLIGSVYLVVAEATIAANKLYILIESLANNDG